MRLSPHRHGLSAGKLYVLVNHFRGVTKMVLINLEPLDGFEPSIHLRITNALLYRLSYSGVWWALLDLNQRQTAYEAVALTN